VGSPTLRTRRPTAHGGEGALGGLSNADSNAKESSFGGQFASGLGKGLGAGLSSWASGGFKNPFSRGGKN
jgi:hypothetical protein